MVFGGSASVNLEKRELAPFPEVRPSAIGAFPSGFESYFNDRIPFRNDLIWLNSVLDYTVFATSSNDEVVLGKDGWLFFKNSIVQETGRVAFTADELDRIARNLQAIESYCNERGITFVLCIAPNKEHVYNDELPDPYVQRAEIGQYERVILYLAQHTNLTVVHPETALAAWRRSHPEPVGYLTDTHWNSLGGYIGARELLAALGRSAPELRGIALSDLPEHDLADMLHLDKTIGLGKDYVPVFDETATLVEDDFYGHVRYENPQGEGKILLRRDSFCNTMHRPLSQSWASYDAVHPLAFTWSMLDEYKPDVFVFELVERSLPNLVDISLPS